MRLLSIYLIYLNLGSRFLFFMERSTIIMQLYFVFVESETEVDFRIPFRLKSLVATLALVVADEVFIFLLFPTLIIVIEFSFTLHHIFHPPNSRQTLVLLFLFFTAIV